MHYLTVSNDVDCGHQPFPYDGLVSTHCSQSARIHDGLLCSGKRTVRRHSSPSDSGYMLPKLQDPTRPKSGHLLPWCVRPRNPLLATLRLVPDAQPVGFLYSTRVVSCAALHLVARRAADTPCTASGVFRGCDMHRRHPRLDWLILVERVGYTPTQNCECSDDDDG
jgi:hypothetical protein